MLRLPERYAQITQTLLYNWRVLVEVGNALPEGIGTRTATKMSDSIRVVSTFGSNESIGCCADGSQPSIPWPGGDVVLRGHGRSKVFLGCSMVLVDSELRRLWRQASDLLCSEGYGLDPAPSRHEKGCWSFAEERPVPSK